VTTATVDVDAIASGPETSRPPGPGAWQVTVADGVVTAVTAVPRPPGRLHVLTPVLVNGHDHGRGQGTQLLGVRDGLLDPWIADFIRATPPDSQYDQVSAAVRQMRDGGVGAVSLCLNLTTDDQGREVREAVRAVRDAGVRAAIAVPLITVPRGTAREGRARDAGQRAAAEKLLDELDALAAEVEGPDVTLVYHPVGPQWVDEDVLAAVAERSAATGRVVHTHLLETAGQRQWADRTYPDGIVPALDELGLLTPRTVLAHGAHLRAPELRGLARRGCTVVANASSNLRLASGVPPLEEMAAQGTRIAVGLDGMTLDDDLDMWRELRLVRGLWQGQRLDTVPAAVVLATATHGGAAGFGPAAPAPFGVGGTADFVVHDLSRWAPVAARPGWPAEEVVLAAASRATVREVWCAGARVVAPAGSGRAPAGDFSR
jgi:cytosine/adenosine deaminase-related metal-dependent hydrolase